MQKEYYVYIRSNRIRTVLYIGVTSDIHARLTQHQSGERKSFTAKYNVKYLIYFEVYDDVREAIAREKQLKKWKREKKMNLIRSVNPGLLDISSQLL